MSVLFRYLNSIMILLIPSSFMLVYLSIIFKFHYDSINSTSFVLFVAHLNSFKFHYDSINSRPIRRISLDLNKFKFHYDSINSLSATSNPFTKTAFKFHYDSINSHIHRLLTLHYNLNLNSIMILLILSCSSASPVVDPLFKFHYDSINSACMNLFHVASI